MKKFFIGHGSPMNIIQDNPCTRYLSRLGKDTGKPSAVVVVSAHWQTEGTWITGNARPKQIYDFGGFPRELYETVYAPPGSEEVAARVHAAVPEIRIHPDRGIDHAAWAVMCHMYPDRDVPLLEISLDRRKSHREHFDLGALLGSAGLDDCLLMGSGNLIHNLYEVSFQDDAVPFGWASEADAWLADRIRAGDTEALLQAPKVMPGFARIAPTDEHWLPFLYFLGMGDGGVRIAHREIQNGSVSMMCLERD